jgi:hypothetical protein
MERPIIGLSAVFSPENLSIGLDIIHRSIGIGRGSDVPREWVKYERLRPSMVHPCNRTYGLVARSSFIAK